MGPDAARYLLAGAGHRVARPFNLRWLLPAVCGDDVSLWRLVWLLSWPLAAAGAFCWAFGVTSSWQVAAATTVLLLALPGIWGPKAIRPVGVDLPAMALGLLAAGAYVNNQLFICVVLVLWAACIKETTPIWVALWVWHPLPLIGLGAVAVAALIKRPALDSVTARSDLREIHDHPLRSALQFREGRWRDAWLWVAPWGATAAALVPISTQTAVTLGLAHLQLLVATDQVRLVQYAAGPIMALAAAKNLPLQWLPLVVVLHVFWWRQPETV